MLRLAVVAVFSVVSLWLVEPLIRHTLDQDGHRLIDLEVYREAGRAVLDGRPVYDFRTVENLPFTYPPIAAWLSIPLALVSSEIAGIAWTWLNLGLFAALLYWLARPVWSRLGPVAGPLLFGGLMWTFPFRDNLGLGQVNLVLMALVVLDCYLPKTKWPRGALVGLATAIKLTPGLFVPYLWLSGRRREAINATVTFLVLAALTFVILPRDSARYWFGEMFNPHRLGNNHFTANQSIRGMVLHLQLKGVAAGVLLVALSLLVLWLVLKRAPELSRRGDELAALAVVGAGTNLLSPVSWIHHMVWFLLAFVVLVDDWKRWARVAFGIGLVALLAYKTPYLGARLARETTGVLYVMSRLLQSCFTLAALAVVAWLPPRPRLAKPSGAQRAGESGDGNQREEPAREPAYGGQRH